MRKDQQKTSIAPVLGVKNFGKTMIFKRTQITIAISPPRPHQASPQNTHNGPVSHTNG